MKIAKLASFAVPLLLWSLQTHAGDKPSWKPYSAARAAAAKQGFNRYLAACKKQGIPEAECRCRALNYALGLLTGKTVNRRTCCATDFEMFELALRAALIGKTAKAMGLLGSLVLEAVPGPGVKGSPVTKAAAEAANAVGR